LNNKIALLIIGLLTTLLMSSITFGGCNNNPFRTMTVKNKIASFSFEYSSFYEDHEGPTVLDKLTGVELSSPKKRVSSINPNPMEKAKTVTIEYVPARIDVDVYDARDRNATAHGDLENWLLKLGDDINILERKAVIVSGVQGEQVVFTGSPLFPIRSSTDQPKPIEYTRTTYFDYAGLIWNIEAVYEASMDERLKVDYEHIVQTFKILE
jgi:hypothetical protein